MVREIARSSGEEGQRLDALERTLESVREDSEVAHVLLALSAALAEVTTVEQTLDKAVHMVPELWAAERCFAVAGEEDEGRFEIRAHHGFDERELGVLHELAATEDGLPLVRSALLEDKPILVGDVSDDERIGPVTARTRELGACIAIPLSRRGDRFAGLGVEFSRPRPFGPKDVALARGVARQMGVALANARRFGLLQTLRTYGLRAGSELRLAAVVAASAAGAVELLGGDAAVLYFVDATHGNLVASGGHGITLSGSDELAQLDTSTDPWGRLRTGESVFVEDLARVIETTTRHRAALAVPIPGPEASGGAIVVFFRAPVELLPEEKEAMNVLTAQAASAIENAQRFERQQRVARSLQSGIMATEMPELQKCKLGAVYEPAGADTEVGGDFFDVFELADGRVGLVVGDVSGKGAEAAAQTAMAKYMLRAFAMRNASPSSVLFHLNKALVRNLEEDRFTTVLYGVLDPVDRSIQLAVGGHPPALVFRRDQNRVEVAEPAGSILGAFDDEQYDTLELTLGDGDVFLAHTDGLAEARNDGEMFGRKRIIDSLKRHSSLQAQDLARRIYLDASEFGAVEDDTVVFTLTCG